MALFGSFRCLKVSEGSSVCGLIQLICNLRLAGCFISCVQISLKGSRSRNTSDQKHIVDRASHTSPENRRGIDEDRLVRDRARQDN